MLSAFKSWMQLVGSAASILSSELKTHQECSVELSFKFQTSLVSNWSNGVYKIIEIVWSGVTWKSGDVGVTNLRFSRIYWCLVISKYTRQFVKKLLTIWAVPSKAIFCASSTRNLCFIKPSFEMSSSNLL